MNRVGSVGCRISKAAEEEYNKTITEEEERGDEKAVAEEQFYESLDRIASSSCSCSASNSDSDLELNTEKMTKLPLQSSRFSGDYDIWISEPAPVIERRQRLLLQMGLLGRSKFLANRRTLSCDGLSRRGELSVGSPQQSRLDYDSSVGKSSSGAMESELCRGDRIRGDNDVDLYSYSLSSSASALSITNLHNCDGRCKLSTGHDEGNFDDPKSAAASPHKPPSGKLRKKIDESAKSNENADSNLFDYSSSGEVWLGSDDEGAYQVCRIKDLDNGKEFLVNEVNKLREVGTGKQLTMEEFEICVGHSPIVQELMRRQSVEIGKQLHANVVEAGGLIAKKKVGGWFSTLKSNAKTYKERSSDERDTGSERAGRRSSSATDDSQDVSFHGPERVRVKQYGKTYKEMSALYKSQEIQAHNGSIWSIKFSMDGRYLASAGEDGVIHVWQVVEAERKGELLMEKQEDGNFNLLLFPSGSPEPSTLSPSADTHHERKRRGRSSISRKSLSLDHIYVPDTVFALSDKPVCSFYGHYHDVLDLSWSKSQHILSSSMDKTVRLWHLSSKSCLKIFSHSDYVTCIQFNPVDDRFFISGSLDAKIRIWSIPDRQVVDWTDLREMVTSACYTPDGQGAFVGTYKGSCRLYNTSDNKLHVKRHINLQNRKKKAHLKKITGFQFAPGSSSEVLVSSADSRIRVVDGVDLVHKFKGFRNTNSQISASITANGKYVVAASEDSYVYVWKNETETRLSRTKGVSVTRSYEHFHCQDVSVAIPWPGLSDTCQQSNLLEDRDSAVNYPSTPVDDLNGHGTFEQPSKSANGIICNATNGYFFDRISATWPEEKLGLTCRNRGSRDVADAVNGQMSAYGMVIVTAGLRGEIRTFQNFGMPVRI